MDFNSIFSITREQMAHLLETAMGHGGQYADIFFEYTTDDDLILRDKSVGSIGCDIDCGAGIRVLSGEKTGYAYTESLDIRDLERAALSAASIADGRISQRGPVCINDVRFTNHYPITRDWELFPVEERREYLQELDEMIAATDSRIKKTILHLSGETSYIMFLNSLGDFYCDIRPKSALTASCMVSDGNSIENVSFSRSFRAGSEMFNSNLLRLFASQISRRLEHIFEAGRPKGGSMPVVLASGGAGILLHEAIGHAFEADFCRKGTSIFADSLGKMICSSKINVVDDATLRGNRGSLNVDDEGVPGQKTYMVHNGKLTSFLHDRISARHYGVAPTGNGRRESFRFNPIPRMRATYMEDGEGTARDIISTVKKGIYVENFTNGQVEIGAGDFTFYVKSGFMIENGHLTAPIKDINITGNGPRALADIVEVASDSKMEDSTWTCGKDQLCPVSCGMPTVLVKSLTVGGDN